MLLEDVVDLCPQGYFYPELALEAMLRLGVF